jgi:ABC-type nitrate/sulfonate/bicarbonate transport system substrate-binding protein
MTGSPLVGILVPVAVVIVLAAWLALVFYADAHPDHAARAAAAERGIASETTSGDARQRDEHRENTSSPEEQDAAHPGGRSTGTAPERPAA